MSDKDQPVLGRPPMFTDPQKLNELIEDYFESEDHYTITGLCLHCGFESRQSFYDYEQKPAFAYIVKRARLRIENMYEKSLMGDKVTGPIFALKNMGWTDKQEIDHTTRGQQMAGTNITVTASDLKSVVDKL